MKEEAAGALLSNQTTSSPLLETFDVESNFIAPKVKEDGLRVPATLDDASWVLSLLLVLVLRVLVGLKEGAEEDDEIAAASIGLLATPTIDDASWILLRLVLV
jgi:hypothetical protein